MPARRIALLMDLDLGCCRNLVRGIHTYALPKQDWVLRNSPCDPGVLPFLRQWKPDGIIATVFDRQIARALVRLRRPVVDMAFSIRGLKLPVVDVDHEAVGRLAAEHLREQGCTRFAFLGSKSALYSEVRAADAGDRPAVGFFQRPADGGRLRGGHGPVADRLSSSNLGSPDSPHPMISYTAIETAMYEAMRRAAAQIPPDIEAALRRAWDEEQDPLARQHLQVSLENFRLSAQEGGLVCGDTGFPLYFVTAGRRTEVEGGFASLWPAAQEATARVTRDSFLRPTMVDPLSRDNPGDNVGPGMPKVELRFEGDGDGLAMVAAPKGGGSEIFGTFYRML